MNLERVGDIEDEMTTKPDQKQNQKRVAEYSGITALHKFISL